MSTGNGNQYTDELRQVKQDIEKLAAEFRAFVRVQTEHNQEIKQLLAGSEYGEDGLVKKHFKLEQRVEKLETLKNRAFGYLIGIASASGGITAGLIELIFG